MAEEAGLSLDPASPHTIRALPDFTLNYVGHAETWDKLDLDGSIEEHDCKLSFRCGGSITSRQRSQIR